MLLRTRVSLSTSTPKVFSTAARSASFSASAGVIPVPVTVTFLADACAQKIISNAKITAENFFMTSPPLDGIALANVEIISFRVTNGVIGMEFDDFDCADLLAFHGDDFAVHDDRIAFAHDE